MYIKVSCWSSESPLKSYITLCSQLSHVPFTPSLYRTLASSIPTSTLTDISCSPLNFLCAIPFSSCMNENWIMASCHQASEFLLTSDSVHHRLYSMRRKCLHDWHIVDLSQVDASILPVRFKWWWGASLADLGVLGEQGDYMRSLARTNIGE